MKQLQPIVSEPSIAFPSPEQKRLDVAKVEKRMAEEGLSASDVARKLNVSRETVSNWLAGDHLPRPGHLIRLGMTLSLTYEELILGAAPYVDPQVCVLVGLPGRAAKAVVEQVNDDAGQLVTVACFLLAKPVLSLQPLLAPSLSPAHLDDTARAVRSLLGLTPQDGLNASHFLRLLQCLGAHVTPSLRGATEREHWSVVTHIRGSQHLFVHWPVQASPAVRLQGLAESLGVCLTLHALSSADARKYGQALAHRLLTSQSSDDIGDRIQRDSELSFYDSTQAAGLGSVMNAIEQFQLGEGGRNHAFVSHALRVTLADAYALSAMLYPSVRERIRSERETSKAAQP